MAANERVVQKDPLLTAQQIYELVDHVISLRGVYRAMHRGELPHARIGTRLASRLSWVERWLAPSETKAVGVCR